MNKKQTYTLHTLSPIHNSSTIWETFEHILNIHPCADLIDMQNVAPYVQIKAYEWGIRDTDIGVENPATLTSAFDLYIYRSSWYFYM